MSVYDVEAQIFIFKINDPKTTKIGKNEKRPNSKIRTKYELFVVGSHTNYFVWVVSIFSYYVGVDILMRSQCFELLYDWHLVHQQHLKYVKALSVDTSHGGFVVNLRFMDTIGGTIIYSIT
jgi:hypothetical protein